MLSFWFTFSPSSRRIFLPPSRSQKRLFWISLLNVIYSLNSLLLQRNLRFLFPKELLLTKYDDSGSTEQRELQALTPVYGHQLFPLLSNLILYSYLCFHHSFTISHSKEQQAQNLGALRSQTMGSFLDGVSPGEGVQLCPASHI